MSTAAPFREYGTLVARKTLPKANAIVVGIAALGFAFLALSAGPLDGTSFGFLLFAVGLLALCAWALTYTASIYENGAVVQSVFGSRSLPFRDLKTFGYSRVVIRAEPQDTLALVPRTGKPLRIVTKPRFRSGPDADLASLVDRLTARFSEQLEKDLTKAKRVPWITRVPTSVPAQPGVALSREAFLVHDGKTESKLLFAEVESSVENGTFVVRQLGTKKALFSVPCQVVGFYPGFALQGRLREVAGVVVG